jgi:zinc transport system substrate-binding protein
MITVLDSVDENGYRSDRMRLVAAIVAAVTAAVAAGCGASSNGGGRTVVAAFYPLAFAAEAVAGAGTTVRNLTPPGAEPHDVELGPRDVAKLQRADLVLYLSHGFQPAVERAVDDARGKRVDLLEGVHLHRSVEDEGEADPHVWLDPALYAHVVDRIGAALGRPARVHALVRRVRALDTAYRTGLAHCKRREFVTSHAAFGYVAARYGLRQVAITGIDPESEPSASTLRDLARFVRRDHVRTVFFERLVSPKLAETVAREAGVRTAVLDPIEGLTPDEQRHGTNYFTLMRANLRELRTALECR